MSAERQVDGGTIQEPLASAPQAESVIGDLAAALLAMGSTAPATLLLDRAGRIRFHTPACTMFWAHIGVGLGLDDLVTGPDLDSLQQAITLGVAWSGRLDLTVGNRVRVDVTAAVAETSSGTDSGIRWIQVARTTDHAAERDRVAGALERSAALLDAMPDLLFRLDADLRFLDYRDPTTRGLGMAPDQFLGKHLEDFLPLELCRQIEPNLRRALESDQIIAYTSSYEYEDGVHTFDNRVVKSGHDEVVLICRDTTEQTRAVEANRREQARLQRIVENSREFTTISDAENRLVYVSPPIETILGFSPDELIGTDAFARVHPGDLETALDAGMEDGLPFRLRLKRSDHEWRTFEVVIRSLYDDPQIGGLLTHCRDVTDYVAVQADLVAALDKQNAILETAAEGIITTNDSGIIESVNTAAAAMFGRSPNALIGSPFELLLSASAREPVRNFFARADGADKLPAEVHAIRPAGDSFPVALSASTIVTGDRRIVTMIISDTSEREAFQHQLHYQATHDILTGLPNRTLFDLDVDRALRRMEEEGPLGPLVGVLFVDLDRFKVVNDSLGHGAGDQLLKAVADRLVVAIRSDGTVARFGGDEFLVMCPRLSSAADAELIAERILDAFGAPFDFANEQAFLSASIGIAVAERGAPTDAITLVRNADAALYRAKGAGRAQSASFGPEMAPVVDDQLGVEAALRAAIARQELVTHFQPLYSLTEERCVGTEALLRWRHDGRLIPPIEFIPVAEESGLINEIGAWVMLDACRRTMTWNQTHSPDERLHVAVNVSARQFERSDFVDRVRRILSMAGIPANDVVLELTETSIVSDDMTTLDRLAALKDLGVRLAIDDFGIGYSSLSYLRHLPVDIIKIDRSFISQLEHDAATVAIVHTITNLAHTLGKTVVAEGVESEVQLDVLMQLDCDQVQGFYFAKPAPYDEVEPLLFEHSALDLRTIG